MIKRRSFLKTLIAGSGTCLLPGSIIAKYYKDIPNVLLLGDSISIGYTKFVQESLVGKAKVQRPLNIKGSSLNCQGTTFGVKKIDEWLEGTKWDIIHFNFGLHDLKHVDATTGKNSGNPNDPQQADLKTYKKNLKVIVKKLMATDAKLIFATTTPYPDKPGGPLRRADQPEKYNRVALKIMKKRKILINDLYEFALPRLTKIQKTNNVHFSEIGSKALAEQVVEKILAVI